MKIAKLLLVDDDPQFCQLMTEGLASDFEIVATDDPDVAYRIAVKNQPDVLLLDVELKIGNGIDLCRKLRKNQLTRKMPVLIISGHGDVDRMLASYEVGADDYIEKPATLTVIRARLKARVNRYNDLTGNGASFGNLKLYPERFEVEVDGRLSQLSELEFDLLRIFLTNPNENISRQEILETVWAETRVTERAVDVHISALRRKLKGFNHTIRSLYGRGYILRPIISN